MQDTERALPGNARRWLAVVVLAGIYVLSFVDRQLPVILIEPIKAQLRLTDAQLGLMSGTAFALCYTILGVPISQAADRFDRRWIIMAGVALWSLMTAAAAAADQFGYLFLSRMGVGLGEAAFLPAAYALIADLFDSRRRAFAYGLLVLGAPLGTGLSMMLGGSLLHWWPALPLSAWFPQMAAWQGAFLIVGLSGFLWVALTATLPKSTPSLAAYRAQGAFRSTLACLWSDRRFFAPFLAAITCWNVVAFSHITWTPSILVRGFGQSISDVAVWLGTSFAVSGALGCLLAPVVVRLLDSSRRKDSSILVIACCATGFCALVCMGALCTTADTALAFWWAAPALLFAVSTLFPAIALARVPTVQRARVSAICLLIANVAGIGVGPPLVGYLAERVFADAQGLRHSLAITSGILGMLVAVSFASLLRERFAHAKYYLH